MAELSANVRLNLTSTAENVVLVREMLSGVAEAIGLDGTSLNDIRTAVTEACNNVVLHAYAGEQGPLHVEVFLAEETLAVLVSDRGIGLQMTPDEVEEASIGGIGLHVIQTLADRVELQDAPDGGTEVRMKFATPGAEALEPLLDEDLDPPNLALAGSSPATTVSIAPLRLAGSVLPRMVSALAARAHFSTDRISDVQILADALVAHADQALDGDRMSIGVHVEPRELELRIAPLGVGRARDLLARSEAEGLGSVIEKLTNRHGVATAERYETLTLGLIDRR